MADQILSDILDLCRAKPDAEVLLENAHRHVGLVPLSTVLTVGRRVSPFLSEGVYLFVFGETQAPMRAKALATLVTNPSLAISLHREGDLIDFENLGGFRLYSARFDDETIVIDCAPPSPLRAFMKLAAENPDAQVVYRDPYADPEDPEDLEFRPITTVDAHPIQGTEPNEPNHTVTLFADPHSPPLAAGEILRLVQAEMKGRRVAWTYLEAGYPLPEEEQRDGIYSADDEIETVVLHEGKIVLTAHAEAETIPTDRVHLPPVEIGDIVVGGPGWAWGQRFGEYVFVSDIAEQHRAFKVESLAVQGWAAQQEAILRSGIRSLYKPVLDTHGAYDEARGAARFWVQATHLYRGGRITHREGLPMPKNLSWESDMEPGDAILVEAVRLNAMGAVDLGAEKVRFIQSGVLDGDSYVMRAQPLKIGSVYSDTKDET